MIKAILFDFGGTLVYTDEIDKNDGYKVGKALYGYFKKHGIDLKLNPQQTYDAFVEGCKKMKKESKENNNFDLQPYDLFTKWVFVSQLKNVDQLLVRCIANNAINTIKFNGPSILRPGCKEAIKKLHSMGLKLGIISNTSSMNFVSIRLLQEDLLKYFDTNCIFLSSSSGMKKPNPIIFQVACRDIGVKFNEIAYVGDTLDKDVNASRKAGFKLSIRIAIDRADIISQGKEADYVIKKLTEIPNIITKVNKK